MTGSRQFASYGVVTACLLVAASLCAHAQAAGNLAAGARPAPRGPVLVELFTSEGCPHCPEADALLERMYSGQTIEGAQIIALEEHVDYWDGAKWVDHFSSPAYTERQRQYGEVMDLDSLYTPQMVVDGLVELVGNNEGRARATISALGRAPKPAMRIVAVDAPAGAAHPAPPARVRIEVQQAAHTGEAEVVLVVAEDKLFSRVSGGSNAGESWPHSSVARWIRRVGKLPAGQADLSLEAAFDPPGPGWRNENLRLIAFVQEEESRRVLAVCTMRLADLAPRGKAAATPPGTSAPPVSSNTREQPPQ